MIRVSKVYRSLKWQFHKIFWYTFPFISQLHLGPWLSGVKLFPYCCFTFAVILTLFFFCVVSHNANKKKILKLSMFENGFVHLYYRYCYMCLFWVFCSLKGLQWGLNFWNINLCCSSYSALLPTKPKKFQRCCHQRRTMIGVVAYNADHFSALWATARKDYRRCCLHSGKIIGVADNNAEKCSNHNRHPLPPVCFRFFRNFCKSWDGVTDFSLWVELWSKIAERQHLV